MRTKTANTAAFRKVSIFAVEVGGLGAWTDCPNGRRRAEDEIIEPRPRRS